jgi:hypothetical protein
VLVFILAVMWSVYLGMWLLSRRERRSMNSIAAFNKHLAVLGRTSPGRSFPARATAAPARLVAPPLPGYAYRRAAGMTLTDARNRRRQVLTALAASASVTAALAFLAGGPMLVLHVGVDVVLAGYVVLLARAQQLAAGHRSTVVYLPRQRQVTAVAPEPAYLQRSAN